MYFSYRESNFLEHVTEKCHGCYIFYNALSSKVRRLRYKYVLMSPTETGRMRTKLNASLNLNKCN